MLGCRDALIPDRYSRNPLLIVQLSVPGVHDRGLDLEQGLDGARAYCAV